MQFKQSQKERGALDGRRIGEALVLVFNTAPFKRPIRPHRYVDYVDILADWAKKRAPNRVGARVRANKN